MYMSGILILHFQLAAVWRELVSRHGLLEEERPRVGCEVTKYWGHCQCLAYEPSRSDYWPN